MTDSQGYMKDLATTAEYRNAAIKAEKANNWEQAAELWQRAIAVYPSTGRLAEIDLAKMKARMLACIKMPTTNEMWDDWYALIPPDLRRKLSLHDFKRLGDLFKTAFRLHAKEPTT